MSSPNRLKMTVLFPDSYKVWQDQGLAGCRFPTSQDAVWWVHHLNETKHVRVANLYINHDYINLPYLVTWRTV